MTITLSEAADEARYVTFSSDRRIMAVWYGTNTVSFFLVENPTEILVVETVPIGAYRFGETTKEQAEETIDSVFEAYRREAP